MGNWKIEKTDVKDFMQVHERKGDAHGTNKVRDRTGNVHPFSGIEQWHLNIVG